MSRLYSYLIFTVVEDFLLMDILLFHHLSRGLELPLFWTTAARIVEEVEVGSSGTRGLLVTFPLNFPASSKCGVPSPGPLTCACMYTCTYRCTCINVHLGVYVYIYI